jgi:hypothetical protein
MKPVVYIETSVISYLTARPSRDVVIAGRQAITLDWWERERQGLDLRVSALVEDEAGRGDAAAADHRAAIIKDIANLAVSDLAVALRQRNSGKAQMIEDWIVLEVRKHREEHAASYGHHLRRIAAALRERERQDNKSRELEIFA